MTNKKYKKIIDNKVIGHDFLMSLGKTKLRPGGVKATRYLIDYIVNNVELSKDSVILEVSCNRGYTLIDLAKRVDCHIVGIDINKHAIDLAQKNIEFHGLSDRVKVYHMNGSKILFEDKSFDVVINEAMLTMYKDKNTFLNEYHRVLKDNGYLLNHDVSICVDDNSLANELKEVINFKPYPLSVDSWIEVMNDNGFKSIDYTTGPFTLMTLKGMLIDEGFVNTIRIMFRAHKRHNRKQFVAMRKYFISKNNELRFIAMINKKI